MSPAPSATPVQRNERLEFVDILRGFALIGVLAANLTSFSGYANDVTAWADMPDKIILVLIQFLIRAKFYTLFSFLFGWGMAAQMLRAETKGYRFVPMFVRRLVILLIFGLTHGMLIWTGDILTFYAVLGLLLLTFRNRSERTLLISAVLCLLLSISLTLPGDAMDSFRQWYDTVTSFMRRDTIPTSLYATGSYWEITQLRVQEFWSGRSYSLYTFGNVFAMFLLGLYVGKRRIFHHTDAHQSLIRRTMWFSLITGILFNTIFVWNNLHPDWVAPQFNRLVTVGSRTIGAPALALFYITAIILLTRQKRWLERLRPLADVGRLALTNYLIQSIILTLVFYNYGLGLYGQTDPSFGLIITIILYISQMRMSKWWLSKYQFGPLEWLWRVLTYGRRQPLRHGETYQNLPQNRAWTRIRRLPSALTLGLSWLILLLWAAGLLLWYRDLQARPGQLSFQIAPQVTATPGPTRLAAQLEEESRLAVIATPQVGPVAYSPGNIARSGDMLALADTFDVTAALAQIELLTGPPYRGRRAASAGGLAAGEYLARQFEQLRLQPAGDDGTFFQTFPVSYTNLATVPQLALTMPDGDIQNQILYEDFSPIMREFVGAGHGGGQVVWLDTCGHDDFGHLDVQDKIVLCCPDSSHDAILTAGREAVEHGAAGLLLATTPQQRPPDMGDRFNNAWVPEPIPALRVYPDLVDELFIGSGATITDMIPLEQPLPLLTQVEMRVDTTGDNTCPTNPCQARNVLGVLPGRDPAFADEIVVISAHHDHLGESPDGTVWVGANDDASGVAVLLEIARSWQEQGYVPRRTVLFAAWDAEELGLLGSAHFVQNPQYPLENIVALIQLDMVGAGGDILFVDGADDLAAAVQTVGERLAIPIGRIPLGRSDHIPFLNAGVPAALLIWLDEDGRMPTHYHRPADTLALIEPEKLEAVGRLVGAAALNLAESEPAIMELAALREAAVSRNNLTAFLETSQSTQMAVDSHWFNDIQSLNPITVSIGIAGLQVSGDTASGDVLVDVRYPAAGNADGVMTVTGEHAVQFRRGQNGWQWAGPHLTWLEESGVRVGYPPQLDADLAGLGDLTREQYRRIATTMGLPPGTAVTLELLPDAEAVRAGAALTLDQDQTTWINPGIVKLAYSQGITTSDQLIDALVQLALANAGVEAMDAPWLWRGLPLVWRAQSDSAGVQSAYLPPLHQALANDAAIPDMAAAWAATDYLLQEVGWTGLGRFITELGSADLDTALSRHMQMDANSFESAWQTNWERRLTAVQNSLDALLTNRTDAILGQDEAAFLQTVDTAVPFLLNAQRRWLADLALHPILSFSQSAQPLALLADGSVLAQVNLNYQLLERGPSELPVTILFTPTNDGYLWAGKRLNELPGSPVNVRYPEGEVTLAQAIQIQATNWYTPLAAALTIPSPGPIQIELYDEPNDFRAAIALPYPMADRIAGWTEPDQAIKLNISNQATPDAYNAELISQMTRQLLYQTGVDEEWLLLGLSSTISRQFDGGAAEMAVAAHWPALMTAVADDSLLDLTTLPPDVDLTRAEAALARVQAWDVLRYWVNSYGAKALPRLWQEPGDFEGVFTAVTGQSQASFMSDWTESLAGGHIQPTWIELVQDFDDDRVMTHIETLTTTELNGRLAGTAGAEEAADYIADQFRVNGLRPAGENGGFFQTLPITFSSDIDTPHLEIVSQSGETITFPYREAFLPVRPAVGGELVNGELFFVQASAGYENVNFEGGIVVNLGTPVTEEGIVQAVEHGAGALILVSDKKDDADLFGKRPYGSFPTAPIPVLELTRDGYNQLLDVFDLNRDAARKLPPIQSMAADATAYFAVSPPESRTTANILGFLPGSDPILRQETVIVGAHYDHVGDDPDGRRYSGANDNASGVAVMLEIARLWQSAGYRPQRSVLFVAWGGQELGNLGSNYYAANPTRPFTDTIALLQLDGVGGGDGFALGVQGEAERDGLLLAGLETAVALLGERAITTPEISPSDHDTFDNVGFPAVLISWRLAREANLSDDVAHKLSPDNLRLSGQATALLTMSLTQ